MLDILSDNIYIILDMLGDNYLVDTNKISRNIIDLKRENSIKIRI